MTRALLLLVFSARIADADPLGEAEHYNRTGKAAYELMRYDEAIVAWRRSFDLSNSPNMHYNLANAYRKRARPGDCVLARTEYERFIRDTGSSDARALAARNAAEEFVRTLHCTATPVERPAKSPKRNRSIATVSVGASGVVFLATGLYLGHRGAARGDEVTRACAVSCDWADLKDKDAGGRRDTKLGYAFDALGIAAIFGSAALYWFGVRESSVQASPIASRSGEVGAALSWRTSW